MKYVIISIYDSWYQYSVNINGILYDETTKKAKDLYNLYWNPTNENMFRFFEQRLLIKYRNYDLIVLCEDGFIQILKDRSKCYVKENK